MLTLIFQKRQFFYSYILYIYVRDKREKKMLATTAESHNNTSGNGQFGSLLRNRRNNTSAKEFNIEDYNYLEKKDRRMRFNNSKDPIYYVFDVIENRPIKTLAKEFVKDSFFEIANFVVKVVG